MLCSLALCCSFVVLHRPPGTVRCALGNWYAAKVTEAGRVRAKPEVRCVRCGSKRLYIRASAARVIVERKLTHPGDPQLDRHVAAAVAKRTGRGWRLDKSARDAQIDAVVGLAMAVERVENQPEPVRLFGWL